MANVHLFRRGFLQAVFFVYTVRTLAFEASSGLGGVGGVVHDGHIGLDHRWECGHVGVLVGPLILLLVLGLGLVTAGGDVGRRWRMLEPARVVVAVSVGGLVVRGELQGGTSRFEVYLGDVTVAAACGGVWRYLRVEERL